MFFDAGLRDAGRGTHSNCLVSRSLVSRVFYVLNLLIYSPKINEIHHAAEQLAPPRLLQLQVDVLGAAAEDVEPIEKVVRAPFPHHRLHVAAVDGHLRRGLLAQGLQIGANGLLAPNQVGIKDVGVVRSRFGVIILHSSWQVVEC